MSELSEQVRASALQRLRYVNGDSLQYISPYQDKQVVKVCDELTRLTHIKDEYESHWKSVVKELKGVRALLIELERREMIGRSREDA